MFEVPEHRHVLLPGVGWKVGRRNVSQIAEEDSEPLKKEDKGSGVGRHDGWDLATVCAPPRRTRCGRGAC